MDKVFLTIQRYGNMSAATVPVALVDALEEGRVAPGSLVLTPAFGGGLTWCAHLIRWGERTTPLDTHRHRPAAADEVGARDGAGVHGEQGRRGALDRGAQRRPLSRVGVARRPAAGAAREPAGGCPGRLATR